MNRDEFKQEAESLTDKLLLGITNLPAPWSFATVLAWTLGCFLLGAYFL